MSDDADDIDAALQARAAQGAKPDNSGDDIEAALQARASAKDVQLEVPKQASVINQLHELASGTIHNVIGGYKGIVTGFATGDADKAADAVRAEQGKGYHAPKDIPVSDSSLSPGAAAAFERGTTMQDGGQVLGDLSERAGFSPAVSAAATALPTALGAMVGGGAKGLSTEVPAVAGDAQAAATRATSAQNAGAASTPVDVSTLTPETQAHLAELDAKGATPNATALANHAAAETLPVPVRLTKGQSLEDENLKSQEFNSKGQNDNAIGKRYDEQDQALRDNLETFHREAAPTAVGNTDFQNGQSIVDSLKRYDQPKKAEISAAYDEAKAANGGDLPMDGNAFVTQAEQNLKASNRARFLPADVKGILDDIKSKDGAMSFDEFEANRTILAEQARKAERAGDGTAKFAIQQVRSALEDTPTSGATTQAKALYDKARGLAKNRFDEMEADPAYDAAANDSAKIGEASDLSDKFANKYVFNGGKANLQRIRAKLDDEGHEAMTSSAYNVLKNKAGVDKGKFIQNGYNNALNNMRQKGVAEELLGGSDNVENAAQLGDVARKAQVTSRGGYQNTSHTSIAGKALALGEHVVRAKAPGIVGTGIDVLKGIKNKADQGKAMFETLRPGAGLSD